MKTKENQLITGRRDMLKMLGFGSAALFMGEFGMIPSVDMYDNQEILSIKKPLISSGRTSVALATGTDRRNMMYEVMKPFEEKIKKGIKGKQVVIKVNMVSTNIPLCATHVDAIHGFLEFMKPIYKRQFIIAEASGTTSDSSVGFKNYGYLNLQKEYDIKFVDLNKAAGSPMWILDQNLYPDKIQIADMFVNPDYYIVSISRLKTHNTVLLTAGTKNIVMGAPINSPSVNGETPINYKRRMHAGGPRWLHYNMYQLAKQVRPDFTIIDGVEGMQGNGPNNGFPADHRIALAGEDVLAVDSLCAKLMGIPLENIGYLNFCAADGLGIIDREKIDILGGKDPDKYVIPYKPNDNIATQLQWKEPLIPPQK
jgi:uncharacterized protein (DUF362 family)